ncbi:MOG interacting and ectopic P-granules protein 1 [Eumeta japonica]|uniref:MOG interacting and ectopic P-granules protein 1 n=1 Tax=Eumeta variegata TaxID=151549 RepID=A0A4C1TNV6_EUMVA|nr:MOG interacting and ectopic P-granules protein 1 [Eumeta japonica]
MKRCEFCNFKSESALAMANHYETPHMNGVLYKCNFCIFEIRNATEIVYHMEAVHNIKARLIKPLPYHQCPNCGFEDNGKAKLARHQPVCAKKFRPEINMAPPSDWEAPAKIPRLKPRHGLVATATAYQAMAAQAAAQKAALASIQQQQQARNLQAAALAAQNAANKLRGRTPALPASKNVQNTGAMMRAANQVRNPAATNVVLPNNYQLGAGGQIIQSTVGKKTSGQPSISITPLPRQTAGGTTVSAPSTSKVPSAGMKPGLTSGGNKAQFVICEICDGYIKDLEQLRNHMQWMHKGQGTYISYPTVTLKFFTDQGLERHLLGSHGLVTSSMQEAANKGKDAGRCPVCGRMYQWKLLNHVSRDHHMTLKPAHLSYKCTVCTATFGMYKQFETHVYTAHSTVAKKAMDGKKNSPVPNTASSSSLSRNSLSAAMTLC